MLIVGDLPLFINSCNITLPFGVFSLFQWRKKKDMSILVKLNESDVI